MENKTKLILISCFVLILFFGSLLVNVHQITPAPHFNDLESNSLLDGIFAIILAGVVLFLSAGLGRLILKPFKFEDWTFLEYIVICLPLGLAVVGYGEFFMGLMGWLKPIHQIVWLIIISIISTFSSVKYLIEGFDYIRKRKDVWKLFSWPKKILFVAGALAIILALFQTFTPPWDYDGLMYHLQGPRLFLEAGKIIPIPENWFTFYPSTWEMLFMLGMGLGSDSFARLIHFSALLLLFLSTFVFGRRFLPGSGGWIAAAIMIGVPMLLVWGSLAYTDIAWALFQFLAVVLIIIWVQNKKKKYLMLSGVMQGFALGSKYLAFSGVGILIILIFWLSLHGKKTNTSFVDIGGRILTFGFSMFLVAFPWYLKNYFWTGNPIFPFYFPQNLIDPIELTLMESYARSFGIGKEWFDYLLLPFTIYVKPIKFSTLFGLIDFPNPLFLSVFIYPWIRKKLSAKSILACDVLLSFSTLQFFAWALGSQQTRFLIPLYPCLSIIASAVLLSLSGLKMKIRWDKIIALGTVSGMVLVSLLLMWQYFVQIKPYKVVLGIQSKSDFLKYVIVDYPVNEYINTQLPASSKVLMPWYGKGYYCISKCIPDIGPSKWTGLILESETISDVTEWLQHSSITHFLLSWGDLDFIAEHDPNNDHRRAMRFLLDDYLPYCAEEVYADNWTSLYLINLENEVCY